MENDARRQEKKEKFELESFKFSNWMFMFGWTTDGEWAVRSGEVILIGSSGDESETVLAVASKGD